MCLDDGTYEQVMISTEIVGNAKNFLIENQRAVVAFHDGQVLFLERPASVVMQITHTEPWLQGNRSSAGTKPATVETGYEVQVPLFIEEGEKIKIDTRSGDYISRVKD